MKKFNKIIISESIIILLLATIIYFSGWFLAYILLAVYIPILISLSYSRQKNKTTVGINKFFKIYTWFLILLVGLFTTASFYDLRELSTFSDIIIYNLPKLATMTLLAGLFITNNYLLPSIKTNK